MIDLEQAILLGQKIALQVKFLGDSSNSHAEFDKTGSAEMFVPAIGLYKDLVFDNCDTEELMKWVLEAIQETSHLASSLYSCATGLDLPMRSFSSVGEQQSDLFQAIKRPARAETFGGFDDKKIKVIILHIYFYIVFKIYLYRLFHHGEMH